VLCLPLIKQATLIGVLYLENNLTSDVFTPARIAVLKLLASQAAISLENTRLYGELHEREGKIRRLIDSNIIGIFMWNADGRILEANDAFLDMVEYSRDDLASGRVRWRELTPAEWRDADERALAALKATGTIQQYEKEFFRKDGSRLPVLAGAATFEARRDEGVAFVLDLTERKQAEAQLQDVAGRLITAQEEERRRIGRELHDHISQQLAVLAIMTDQLLASGPVPPAVAESLRGLRRQTGDIITDVHALSHRLHSTIIDQLGLVPAVKRLTAEWSSRLGIPIDFIDRPMSSSVSSDVALCLFRVAEESLANIAKHAGADTARIEVIDDGGIGLSIEDDGVGFQPETLETKTGLGFTSMRERLRIVGGTMRVRSAPSRGTRVDVWVPAVPHVREIR
jgi:PAS domain S-box-containing protein